jgi:serine-type D-Ala-D-Ala carboxypeptidase/endopeptidase (penicillin-binding protein 4)
VPVRRSIVDLCLVAALSLLVSSTHAQELNPRIESIINSAKIGQATVGVNIVDLSTGRTLADIRSDQAFIPASNQKLLTSGAALLVLSPDFVFRTEILADGSTLILRGSGDPAFADPSLLARMSPKLSVDALVTTLVAAIAKAGITEVTQIVADDRIFDRDHIHASWPKDQLERWYCAPVSGLNFHTNVVSIFPTRSPDGDGRPPVFTVEPSAPWIDIENKARTVPQGRNSVWLSRDPVGRRYAMYGEVAMTSRVPIEVTVFDPALLFAQLIAAELPRAGVSVNRVTPLDGSRRLSGAELDRVLAAARLADENERLDGRVLAVVTTHVRDILERCNNDSQNLYAEALIKRIGHEVTGEPGSWANGSSVIRMMISQDPDLGPRYAASTVIADGSGMSRENRVAPRTFTKWLARLEREAGFSHLFIESLASPGDGTLRRRFADAKLKGELRAKSGKISGVRCLSGYLTDPATNRRVAFSIMVNDLKEGDAALQALRLHEDIVVTIDQWLIQQRPKSQAAAPSSSVTSSKR